MALTVLKGNIVSAPALGELAITEHGYLAAEDGKIIGVFPALPEAYAAAPVEDWGDALILQSFADLHLHAPQYPMMAMGMDLPLLDWLEAYAFPTETRCADEGYVRELYRRLAHDLVKNGTTRVSIFSSLHRPATLILMEELERAGVRGYVGKVNMDRNGGERLQETTEESMRETLRWLEECQDFRGLKPILTPRFTPSCTDALMAFLGKLAQERDLPVQSHLSENRAEMELVGRLHPDCRQYWETYAKFGLWKPGTLMAHCVHSDRRERDAMRSAGVTAVHCAASNNALCSGIAPVRVMLNEGVKVALGSDVAGGDRLSLFDGVAMTDDLAMEAVAAYAEDGAVAVMALEAGNDLVITTDYRTQIPKVLEAVENGTLPEETVNTACRRVLTWKQALGLLPPSDSQSTETAQP